MPRILALDVGHKRIGVALSDPLHITAQGLTTLTRRTVEDDLEAIRQLAEDHEVKAIVVGLPIRLDGSKGPEVAAVEEFIDALAAVVDCPITPWDERFTTAQAEQALIEGGVRRAKRKALRDQVAATLLLQHYLDAHQQPSPE
ncbi:MAG: Holliday junction resolvase RuvX [Candidatus Tectimicrobiota bacterium]